MKLTSTTRLMVVGLTGSGKTYWTNQHIVNTHDSVAVWDPHYKYDVGYFSDASKAKGNRWGVRAAWQTKADFGNAFRAFAARAMELRSRVIVVDEVIMLGLMGAITPLLVLVTQAQNYGCAVVYLAQRAYSVDVTVRSQTSHVISFQQIDKHDIDVLNYMAGEPVFEPARMRALGRGQFVETVVRG